MLSVLDFFFKFLVVKDAIVSASMSSSQPSVCRLPSCPLPALASMSVFESRERSAGFYNGVVGLTFVLWCCTCTDIWIRIAVDAALAQMSESVLLLMLHLHRCLSVYCSWCCTCTDVWKSIAVWCRTCTDVRISVLLLYLTWNLAALCRVKFVRLDKSPPPTSSLSLSLSLCLSLWFFYYFILELCFPDRNVTVKASMVFDLIFEMWLDVYSYVIWVGI